MFITSATLKKFLNCCFRLESVANASSPSEYDERLTALYESEFCDDAVHQWLEHKWIPHRQVRCALCCKGTLRCKCTLTLLDTDKKDVMQ